MFVGISRLATRRRTEFKALDGKSPLCAGFRGYCAAGVRFPSQTIAVVMTYSIRRMFEAWAGITKVGLPRMSRLTDGGSKPKIARIGQPHCGKKDFRIRKSRKYAHRLVWSSIATRPMRSR